MRINEFNMFQNFLKSVTGAAKDTAKPTNTKGVGSAWLRSKKSGLSTEDQLAQDLFIQRFVSRGANALNTAIQQGLVDVTSSELGAVGSGASGNTQAAGSGASGNAQAAGSGASGNAQAGQTQAPSTTAKQPGGKAPGDQAIPAGQKQGAEKPQVDINVDKIVSQMRKFQSTGTKPVPPNSKAAASLASDIPKVSLNKDYLINAGSTILKLNNAGYDVSDYYKQFMAQYAKGNKQKSIQESISHERLTEIYRRLSTQEKFRRSLKRAGYDPDEAAKRIRDLLTKQQQEREQYRDVYKDLGVDIDKHKVDLDERGPMPGAVPNVAAPTAAPAPKPQAKVNPQQQKPKAQVQAKPQPAQPKAQATTQQQAQPTQPAQQVAAKPSIGAWLRDNFMKNFFRGIDFGTAQQQVDDILKRMPQSYKAGTLNKDLTDIANIAYAVSDQGRKQDT